MKEDIDFVITYVNGSDKKWLQKKNKYLGVTNDDGNNTNHFRDWDNLKYWFRGVYKYAPWVHKIYIITDHQVPDWLNTDNPKIVPIYHEDYMDKKDLPNFNSNAIEMKIHKIKNLSEHFVYFNDDMFLTDKVKPTDFFKKGLPRDSYAETILVGNSKLDSFNHFILNNMDIVNMEFNKKKVYKQHHFKYFNLKYAKDSVKTTFFKKFTNFIAIKNPHVATSYLKSTWDYVWDKYKEPLEETSHTHLRDRKNVNIFLFRYFQLLQGKFIPRSNNFGHYFGINKIGHNGELINAIRNNQYKCICINDDNMDVDFDKIKVQVNKAFDFDLHDKCPFER